mmetsp:Transcript_44453/g.102744  ORF Transcript_44453/g.102744 Transcript_44453/m.102744 type:complete len:259 (-) Transcript_44453:127-903(-)|eukprot:CAMPEP_0171101234 /NCGR_PEP_ID=MMETSP0766_2-20121228/54336_1 /TAXON_ID=439317 /ORGANISM="Gambierdiscus australes, Strain CAWD 149" /LENGTH=258 /DNA_ID=CAMNT_0011561225 /DNA_START=63 /DNA_END=839 /DNA_ORIENTATION=-
MDTVNGLASSVEAKLGVTASVAQVITWFAILVLGYLGLQILQGFARSLLRTRRGQGNLALILGQCGSGKTTVFFRLRNRDEEVQTVSSLKPLRDAIQLQRGQESEPFGPVEVVDCPGHQRLRGKAAELLKEARCIIYVIDSEDKQRLKDVAEHLYELMTHPEVLELRTPMLLACNKCDLPSARSEKFIVDDIEREIEQMRVSRAATLEGQDQADSYLGVDGEKFKLLEHAPCPVQTCRISTKKVQLDPLYDFLRQHFP